MSNNEPIKAFSILKMPAVSFGAGALQEVVPTARREGGKALLVTGKHALERSGHLDGLVLAFSAADMSCARFIVDREPSPDMIDRAVALHRDADVVVGIGGGSVLDAGKAISAMLPSGLPVELFIEGRPGFRSHDGCKVPFIAVPTTSGTGSEATNNAVISRVGKDGFKRSLRHEALVPDVAILDPLLMTGASSELTAASGMDACTQLIEALVSPFASPFTDACALEGLRTFSRSFLAACGEGAANPDVRADIAWSAFMSGVALTNAGLGIVHGFASSVGARIAIPHGALCATLLLPSSRENIARLAAEDAGHPAIVKYAQAGSILAGRSTVDVEAGCQMLLETLASWSERLKFPRLSAYGLEEGAIDSIVDATTGRSNPVQLERETMRRILLERL